MRDCKRCEMWKLMLVMVTVAFIVLAWKVYKAEATHEPASKRLDFSLVAEQHLDETAKDRLIRAMGGRFCSEELLWTMDCGWVISFYALNPDGTEERLSFGVFSVDLRTGALGCMLRYETADGKVLVDRSLSETTCVKAEGVNGLNI